MIPTKEQIQWFWEQCGFSYRKHLDFDTWLIVTYPNGLSQTCHKNLIEPPIDLNNLFKYAYPILKEKLGWKKILVLLRRWISDVVWFDKDPALALFWAIYKALGGKDEEPNLYAEVLAEDYGSGGNSEE